MEKKEQPNGLDVLTPIEAASMLRIKPCQLVKLAAKKKVKGFKVGGVWRFHRNAIQSLIVS